MKRIIVKRIPVIVALCIGALLVQVCVAQFRNRRGGSRSTQIPEGGIAHEGDRRGVPDWQVDDGFKKDVFTFVRVKYSSAGGGWGRGGGKWATDYPDSDLNFSFRLQQLTAMKVDPKGLILELTDPALFDYPFLYMIEPGNLQFTQEEVVALRKYCMNGGFMMVDDFWGDWEYENFYQQIKRVFPEREPSELPIEHAVFNGVYQLKEKPQVPSINWARSGRVSESGDPAYYKGIFDDNGRMMVIICHNTDLGDGWEQEGEDRRYFEEFSEKLAYPMGINIVFYAMTH